jgi:hypothetical protein
LDLEIVRDDIDAEIVALLAERERVVALMRQEEAALASLVQLAA